MQVRPQRSALRAPGARLLAPRRLGTGQLARALSTSGFIMQPRPGCAVPRRALLGWLLVVALLAASAPAALAQVCTAGNAGPAGSCTQCTAGYYTPLSGAGTCLPCPAGSVSASAGATSCTKCNANTSAAAGASACTACSGTQVSPAGAAACGDVLPVAAQFVSTLAGTGNGFAAADGQGTSASFYMTSGVAVDAWGNVYVADKGGSGSGTGSGTNACGSSVSAAIRVVAPNGTVTTLISSGLVAPTGVVVDLNGDLYIADPCGTVVYKVAYGTSTLTSYATGFTAPWAVGVDASGVLYVGDWSSSLSVNKVYTVDRTGTKTALAGSGSTANVGGTGDGAAGVVKFRYPRCVVPDPTGASVYVTDQSTGGIRLINVGAATVSTPVGLLTAASGTVASDGVGSLAAFSLIATPTGGPWHLSGMAMDPSGNIWVAERSRLRLFTTSNNSVTTVGGIAGTTGYTDGPISSAQFNFQSAVSVSSVVYTPWNGIAVDSAGVIYAADNNRIRKVSVTACSAGTYLASSGACLNCAAGTYQPAQIVNGSSACLACPAATYSAAGASSCSPCAAGTYSTTTGTTTCTQCGAGYFSGAGALGCQTCPAGYISASAGASSCTACTAGTYAATAGSSACANCSAGQAAFTAAGSAACGDVAPVSGLYVTTVAGSGSAGSVDGTGTTATLRDIAGLAADSLGNVFVAERSTGKVRKVTPDGVVSTFAVIGGASVSGVAIDSGGQLYVVANNASLFRVSPAGVVTTVTTTVATGSLGGYSYYSCVAADANGNVVRARVMDIAPCVRVLTQARYPFCRSAVCRRLRRLLRYQKGCPRWRGQRRRRHRLLLHRYRSRGRCSLDDRHASTTAWSGRERQ